MALEIVNNQDTLTLKFGYLCLRKLGEKWNIANVDEVIAKILVSFSVFINEDGTAKETVSIPFDSVDVYIDILQAATGQETIGGDDFGDWIFANLPEFSQVLSEFMKSLPIVKEKK